MTSKPPSNFFTVTKRAGDTIHERGKWVLEQQRTRRRMGEIEIGRWEHEKKEAEIHRRRCFVFAGRDRFLPKENKYWGVLNVLVWFCRLRAKTVQREKTIHKLCCWLEIGPKINRNYGKMGGKSRRRMSSFSPRSTHAQVSCGVGDRKHKFSEREEKKS